MCFILHVRALYYIYNTEETSLLGKSLLFLTVG